MLTGRFKTANYLHRNLAKFYSKSANVSASLFFMFFFFFHKHLLKCQPERFYDALLGHLIKITNEVRGKYDDLYNAI